MTFFDDANVVVTLYGPPETDLYGQPKPGNPRKRLMVLLLRQPVYDGTDRCEFVVKDCLMKASFAGRSVLQMAFPDDEVVYASSGIGTRLTHWEDGFARLLKAVGETVLAAVDSPYTGGTFDYHLEMCMMMWGADRLDEPLCEVLHLKKSTTVDRVSAA